MSEREEFKHTLSNSSQFQPNKNSTANKKSTEVVKNISVIRDCCMHSPSRSSQNMSNENIYLNEHTPE